MSLTTRQLLGLLTNCFLVFPLMSAAVCAVGQWLLASVLEMLFPGQTDSGWPPALGGAIVGALIGLLIGGRLLWLTLRATPYEKEANGKSTTLR